MPSPPDFFTLFQLPPRFTLDAGALEDAYRRVQAQVHPDRFGAASAAEKRVAMQWAAHANEAVAALRSPVKRAAYLCERNGVPIAAESNTTMPTDFLIQQMQWREALAEADDAPALTQLTGEVESARARLNALLADALDVGHDYTAAAALVRQLMFVEKFAAEVAGRNEMSDERSPQPRLCPADAGAGGKPSPTAAGEGGRAAAG
jgi:molecular chaperone HscB